MSKLFKKLKAGLEDVLAHRQGKLDLRSELIDIPKPPAQYKAKEIKKIRERNRYSQGVFAMVMNVSVKTVQSWESGHRVPRDSALRLMEIIDNGIYHPEIFKIQK
jgi:putative transcriptional regulator